MKLKSNSWFKVLVLSASVAGTVLVVSSQPGVVTAKQDGGGTIHRIIPDRVGLDQLQEFKDAATLHLNSVQKATMSGLQRGSKAKSYIATTILRDFFDKYITQIPSSAVSSGGTGGPITGRSVSPAELAALYYAFDEGVDLVKKSGAKMSDVQSNPMYIEGKMTPKDFGMTPDQFKQAVAQYVESHPMRFWNQARVGLASGR